MKSIWEHKMKCTECGWSGTVAECGDIEHDDGCLDCPVCHSVAIDDWDAEKNSGIWHFAYSLDGKTFYFVSDGQLEALLAEFVTALGVSIESQKIMEQFKQALGGM